MKRKTAQLFFGLFQVLTTGELTRLAKQTGFIQRKRTFTAAQFLYLLFSEKSEIVSASLETLCLRFTKQQVRMTKSALNKRLDERAVLFLQTLFETLFKRQLQLCLTKLQGYPFTRIRILDATTIQLPDAYEGRFQGVHCSSVKVQLEFDYLTQQLLYFQLLNGRAADQPAGMDRLASIQAGELVLQDLGYYQLKAFAEIEQKGAFYVTKARRDVQLFRQVPNPPCHPNGTYIEKHRYERVQLEALVAQMKRGTYHEWPELFVGKEEKLKVRCILYRMTKEQEEAMLKREKRRRQKKQGASPKKSLEDLLSITIYLTNVPMDIPKEEIHELYRLRWQIELLFKSWKSDLEVDTIKSVKIERWLCHFYVESIILLLAERITGDIRNETLAEKGIEISERKAVRAIADTITQLLESIWQSRKQLYDYFDTLTQNIYSFCLKDRKRGAL